MKHSLILFGFLLAINTHQTSYVHAQDNQTNDQAILDQLEKTRIGYVLTGDKNLDLISRQGLEGLSFQLRHRTAIDAGDPIGLNLEFDDLSLFPLIYWPISSNAALPSKNAVNRIDAFMNNGGTILFDTRDEISNLGGLNNVANNMRQLRNILKDIDIPPLEPVPLEHVLTKSFYLLDHFPGRYDTGQLWVEALPSTTEEALSQAAHASDGVSPILITSNDFASAWAMDDQQRPLYPLVPENERQRTLAYRTGINIMMYMLTGNYKADQVHIPSLLERLGQ